MFIEVTLLLLLAAAMAQSVERLLRMRKVGCSNPSRDRPKSLKKIATASLFGNRCERHWSSEMTLLTNVKCYRGCGTPKNPHCSTWDMSAEYMSSIGQNLQPIIGNDDVSID